MLYFYRPEQMLKIFPDTDFVRIFPLSTDQFPVGKRFSMLLYPGSILGPYKPHGVLVPLTTSEQNSPQMDHSKISPHSVYKPLNAKSTFLQPVIHSAPGPTQGPTPDPTQGPTPDLPTFPPEASALQGQISNFLPLNFPMQVYSFVQQAVIAGSDSSEEENNGQVIYMVPVNVNPSNIGLLEVTSIPDLHPEHLHVPTTSSSTVATPAAHSEAQGQLAETVRPETGIERHSGKKETLTDRTHSRGTQP